MPEFEGVATHNHDGNSTQHSKLMKLSLTGYTAQRVSLLAGLPEAPHVPDIVSGQLCCVALPHNCLPDPMQLQSADAASLGTACSIQLSTISVWQQLLLQRMLCSCQAPTAEC